MDNCNDNIIDRLVENEEEKRMILPNPPDPLGPQKRLVFLLVVIILLISATGIITIWNHNQLHTDGMESYYLEIEYSEGRSNENITCNEISMIEEVLFIALFELNPKLEYIIQYGHFNGKFVYDTQCIEINRSTSQYINHFSFSDESVVGLSYINRYGSYPVGLIWIKLR